MPCRTPRACSSETDRRSRRLRRRFEQFTQRGDDALKFAIVGGDPTLTLGELRGHEGAVLGERERGVFDSDVALMYDRYNLYSLYNN